MLKEQSEYVIDMTELLRYGTSGGREMNSSILGKQFWVTVTIIFLLMAGIVTFTFITFYQTSVNYIEALGESNLELETAKIENYLQKGLDIMWVTADSVNFMIDQGDTNEAILDYLTAEAAHQTEQVDENFTGVYGYIRGEYLDGIGWVPPEDYVPTQREWYIAGYAAGGEPTLVSPYLDAQTNTIMMSVSQLLRDKESVVSFDIELNEIQYITENIHMEDMGYGFLVDGTGMVVAHYDDAEKGKQYPLNEEQAYLIKKIYEVNNGSFTATIDGEKCTVFTETVMDEWHVLMIVSNTKLFHEIREKVLIEALICLAVFAIMVLFCAVAYRQTMTHQKKEEESRNKLNHLNDVIIKALAYAIDAKDRYTSGHSQRVANYSVEIARRLGKTDEEQNVIYHAALLHDVGKIRVPEMLINKPGKLTEEEFNQIIPHPICSYHILKNIYEDNSIAFGAKFHHERYDGKGYPDGLSGENIPEVARIIGVADSYDAMASNRSYRKALPQQVVKEEIEKGKGTQFDPKIADIMLQMIEEDKKYEMCQSENIRRRILVADSDPKALESIGQILKEVEEYDVVTAGNFGAIEEELSKESVDMLLLDLELPDIDGFEAFRSIRERYKIPIIFMTREKDLGAIERAADLGADDYVVKPVLPIALKETIHAILSNWS